MHSLRDFVSLCLTLRILALAPHCPSPLKMQVLNEVNYEHGLSPQYYTQIYDWIVAGIKRWAPRGTASLKFVGLAVNELASTMDYATYFLNSSNHAPGIPVDVRTCNARQSFILT